MNYHLDLADQRRWRILTIRLRLRDKPGPERPVNRERRLRESHRCGRMRR